jgi:hypothetical protein
MKIDEVLARERRKEAERDVGFAAKKISLRRAGGKVLEPGEPKLVRRIRVEAFPESRRKTYYQTSNHEHLPPHARKT